MALSTAKLDTAVPRIEINSSVRERGSVLTKKKMGWISITELKVFEFHAHKKSNSAKLLTVKVRVWQWFLGHFDVSSNINHVGLLSFNTCNSHSRTCLVYVYMVFQTERDIEILELRLGKQWILRVCLDFSLVFLKVFASVCIMFDFQFQISVWPQTQFELKYEQWGYFSFLFFRLES